MLQNKTLAALALVLSIMICSFFYWSNPEFKKTQTTPEVQNKTVDSDEHWHSRYVRDSCKRCPECCIKTIGDEFVDPYGVKRPSSWLPDECEDQKHCQPCVDGKEEECLCIKTPQGCWQISPEVGDAE